MKMKVPIFLLFSLGLTLVSVHSTSVPDHVNGCNVNFATGIIQCLNEQEERFTLNISPIEDYQKEQVQKINHLTRKYMDQFVTKTQKGCSCTFSANVCKCTGPLRRTLNIPITISQNSVTTTPSTRPSIQDKYEVCIGDFVQGELRCKNLRGKEDKIAIPPLDDSSKEEIWKLNSKMPRSFIDVFVNQVQKNCACDMVVYRCRCLAPLKKKVIVFISPPQNSGLPSIPTTTQPELKVSTTSAPSSQTSQSTVSSTQATTQVPEIEPSTTPTRQNKYEVCVGDFVQGELRCTNLQGKEHLIPISPLDDSRRDEIRKLNSGLRGSYVDSFVNKVQKKCSCDMVVEQCRCSDPLGKTVIVSVSPPQNSGLPSIPITTQPELKVSTTSAPSSQTSQSTVSSTQATTQVPEIEPSTTPTLQNKYEVCIGDFVQGELRCTNLQGKEHLIPISPLDDSRRDEIRKLNSGLRGSYVDSFVNKVQKKCSCDMVVEQCRCTDPLGKTVIVSVSPPQNSGLPSIPITTQPELKVSTTSAPSSQTSQSTVSSTQATTQVPEIEPSTTPTLQNKYEVCIGDFVQGELRCTNLQGKEHLIPISPLDDSRRDEIRKLNSGLRGSYVDSFVNKVQKKCSCDMVVEQCRCSDPLGKTVIVSVSPPQNSGLPSIPTTTQPELKVSTTSAPSSQTSQSTVSSTQATTQVPEIEPSTTPTLKNKYEVCIGDFVQGELRCTNLQGKEHLIPISPLDDSRRDEIRKLNSGLRGSYVDSFVNKVQKKCSCDMVVEQCRCTDPLGKTVIVSVSPPQNSGLPSIPTTTQRELKVPTSTPSSQTSQSTVSSTQATTQVPEIEPSTTPTLQNKYEVCIGDFVQGELRCTNLQGKEHLIPISPLDDSRRDEIRKLNSGLRGSYVDSFVNKVQKKCSCDMVVEQCRCSDPLGKTVIVSVSPPQNSGTPSIPTTTQPELKVSTTSAASSQTLQSTIKSTQATTEESVVIQDKYEVCIGDFVQGELRCTNLQGKEHLIPISPLDDSRRDEIRKLNSGLRGSYVDGFLNKVQKKCSCDMVVEQCRCTDPLGKTVIVSVSPPQNSGTPSIATIE